VDLPAWRRQLRTRQQRNRASSSAQQSTPRLPAPKYLHEKLLQLEISKTWNTKVKVTLFKKKRKFSSYIKEFRRDRVESHIWWRKNFLIYEEKRKYLTITITVSHLLYDFAPDPFWIPYIWWKLSFLFYQCIIKHFNRKRHVTLKHPPPSYSFRSVLETTVCEKKINIQLEETLNCFENIFLHNCATVWVKSGRINKYWEWRIKWTLNIKEFNKKYKKLCMPKAVFLNMRRLYNLQYILIPPTPHPP
jgi:hypothetical protein